MKTPSDPLWNATDTRYPDELLIHELFEQQVAKTPRAIALQDGSKLYTYEDINNHANQLARALQERGVKQESIVGCYLTHHASIVIYTLAILKAGGTYVLFDANMPSARQQYIVMDAKPTLILADASLPYIAAHFAINFFSLADITLNLASISELENESRAHDSSNLAKIGVSTNAAYISYTSGSTGHPKGVVITHKTTVNHACAFSNIFKLTPSDRVPLMAPVAFDMAIEEMIPPLTSGCTLVVSGSGTMPMPEFTKEVVDNGYTLLNIPAPLWHEWVEYLATQNAGIPPNLRVVIAGSDKIYTKSLASWKSLPGAEAVQWAAAYGTTETTITSTVYTSAATDDLSDETFVPIGKPIANTYVYILDDKLMPVDIGEEGELYIGGQGLAREYRNLEELTRTKFVANPFRPESGARMYQTGDIARYRPDGNVVWLGRSDFQIKLNGLRIEPGDIEAALNRSPMVEESVVLLQQTGDREADKQLVAFVTSAEGQTFNEPELRKLAAEHLPALMQPHRYVHLPTVPVNANGKVDRKALENYNVK